jgi:hypothetical protein
MAVKYLYLGNDYTATLTDLTGNGTDLTSATVTCAILDSAGAAVGSAVTLTGAGNDYTGALESSVFAALTPGSLCQVKFVASQGGYNAEWRETREVAYRPFSA